MALTVSCKDLGGNCDYVAEGKTEKELIQNLSDHAKKDHGMTEIPPELMKKLSRLLREDRAA